MASSLESPTFRWKRDVWVTTPPPKTIEKSTIAQALDDAHQVAFVRAITNVLATDIAELTLAQLVDGLPLWDVAIDSSCYTYMIDEPVFNHKELCPGVMEKLQALRHLFDPLSMEIRTEVNLAEHCEWLSPIRAYKQSSLISR